MEKPRSIEIVRLAYALWQQAGEPDGRDWEFYLQAERELQEQSPLCFDPRGAIVKGAE
jgi:hypothetical protein